MSFSASPAVTRPWRNNSPRKPRPQDSPARPATAPSVACASRSTMPLNLQPSKPSPASCANSSAPAAEATSKKERRLGSPPRQSVPSLQKYFPLVLRQEERYCLLSKQQGSAFHGY